MKIKLWDPGKVEKKSLLVGVIRLIRVEHTLFSLPFAYLGSFLASKKPTFSDIILIALALFGLRAAAMAYNNIADYEIDKMNPRTRNRPLISGEVPIWVAWLIVLIGLTIYFLSAALLNTVSLLLSPIPAIVVLTYPHAKRVHSYPHFHLGFSLGLVVIAGYIAIEGDYFGILEVLIRAPWIWVLAIVFWVAGFDIVYSIMDLDFDKKFHLGSIPARFGVKRSINISRVLHIMFIFTSLIALTLYNLGYISYLSLGLTTLLIIFSHKKLSSSGELDIQKFFKINLVVGIVLSSGVVVEKILYMVSWVG